MEVSKKIGRRIRATRILLGMEQEDLAEKSGIRQRNISRYERGEFKNINPCRLIRLARALQTSTDYLLGEGTNDESTGELSPAERALVGA